MSRFARRLHQAVTARLDRDQLVGGTYVPGPSTTGLLPGVLVFTAAISLLSV